MYIVADIGGTKTRVAASVDLAHIDQSVIIDTPLEYKAGIAAIFDAARTVTKNESIDGFVGGITGIVSKTTGEVLKSRLRNWVGKNIVADLKSALAAEVYFENDVALVALGESHFGAGVGSTALVYMTVSTGVNAAKVVNGSLETCVFNSETGGQLIFNDGRFVRFEDIVSGTAVHEKYGKHPKDLGLGHPVWEELAEVTALGLYNSILHWSPDRVVLGGSMFNEIGISVDRVAHYVKQFNTKYPATPEIVHSALHDEGGLYGGLARLRQLRS